MRPALLFPDPDVDDAVALMRAAKGRGYACLALFTSRWSAYRALREQPPLRSPGLVDDFEFALTPDDLPRCLDRLAGRYDLRGVLPRKEAAVDVAVRVLAIRPFPHLSAAEDLARFRDKCALKGFLRGRVSELRINGAVLVRSTGEVLAALREWEGRRNRRVDFVMKPNEGCSNQDICFFMNGPKPDEMEQALSLHGGRSLLEEFTRGEEYCVNGQADPEGNIHVANIARYERVAANGRQNVYRYQWHVPRRAPVFGPIADAIVEGLRAARLRGLPFHAECFVGPEGVTLGEVGARHGAGHTLDVMQALHAQRYSPCDAAVASAAGEARIPLDFDWDAYERRNYLVVDGISTEAGVVEEVKGVAAVEALPEFVRWDSVPRVGRRLSRTIDLPSEPYAFHLMGESSEDELRRIADAAEGMLRLRVGSRLGPRALVFGRDTLTRVLYAGFRCAPSTATRLVRRATGLLGG